jgi:cytochrome c biogenesis protein CcmG/thiol:disulfide interchange protein DsbE
LKRALYLLPVVLFGVLAFFLYRSLTAPPPNYLPSVLIGKPAPPLTMPALDASTQGFGPAELRAGHVTVLNVWASWCVPCRQEAPQLQALGHSVALYGMVYKDTPAKARAFLDDVGNPFVRIGLDANGRAAIDWGVSGVPETFVIDGKGIVRARFVGAITDEMLANQVLPAIRDAGP